MGWIQKLMMRVKGLMAVRARRRHRREMREYVEAERICAAAYRLKNYRETRTAGAVKRLLVREKAALKRAERERRRAERAERMAKK